jgi:hypothetical protein
MLNILPIPFSLPSGSSVVLWQARRVERHSSPVPIIEILPENHADVGLNFYQRQGISFYDRKGNETLLNHKGQRIDLNC